VTRFGGAASEADETMADLYGGTSRCTVCGGEPRPGAAFCDICGGVIGGPAPPPSFTAPPGALGAPGAPGAPADEAGRVARAWGAVSVAFGALVLAGSAMPWFAASSFALTDDMGSAWPLIVVGLVGVLGGIDGLRGSLLGPAVAGGVGSVFFLLQVVMVRFLGQLPGVEMGGGGVAWTLAAVAAVLLVIAVLSMLRADRARGAAPAWLSTVVLVAGAAWVAGMVLPATPGLSLGDHVEYVLLGGDTFLDVVTVALIGIPAALVVLAALTRSRAAHGLAAGSMVFWVLAAVTAAAGHGSSGDGALPYAFGRFWPMLLGALGVAIGGCVAMLAPVRTAPSPLSGPAGSAGARPVAALAPAVGVVLLPLAGLVGAVQYADGRDAFRSTAASGPLDASGGQSDDLDATDPAGGGDSGGSDGDGGSLDVVCTDLVESAIESVWQDVEGAIHVLVLVDNNCGTGQRLDDPSATFTLTSSGATVADATFDFSSRPVVVPAYGTGEAELVFGPGTFVDLATVETLGLGSDATTGTGAGSLGFTYSYTCTDAPDATTPSSGPALDGRATHSPVPPEPTAAGDALTRLDEIAGADAPFVESDVTDRWVPQISSKKPDATLPDGTVWDAASILDDHRTWRERFPRVRLLWSGDYSTFELTDFWVTIVAVPFDTAEGALGWCDANALPPEDCYAKLISHTHGHDGSTAHR
jgi:hypothetical protein